MPETKKPFIGLDGIFTLFLSIGITLGSLGITYLMAWFRVYYLARTTATQCKATEVIVVHGMKLTDNNINLDFTLRLNRAIEMQLTNDAYILLLGGITGDNQLSEAEAGKQYLIDKGIDSKFIILESNSRHTLENLKEARDIITKMDVKNSSLLSNRYHLARISALAAGMKMNVTLIAAEDNLNISLSNLTRFSLEAAYLHWYYAGKYWSHITRNRHSIDRIS